MIHVNSAWSMIQQAAADKKDNTLKRAIPFIISIALLAAVAGYIYWPVEKIDYNTQVKPIFKKNVFPAMAE